MIWITGSSIVEEHYQNQAKSGAYYLYKRFYVMSNKLHIFAR